MLTTRALATAFLLTIMLTPAFAGGPPQTRRVKAGAATALGSTLADLVFTPVTPCRLLDTRPATKIGSITGPLTPGTTYSFDVAGGACASVPFPVAKAAVLNFVAIAPAGNGNLQAWPFDDTDPPPPNSSILNYGNAGFNIANGIVVPICNTDTATGGDCSDDLFVRANFSATHLVVDVLGYFAAPQATALDCSVSTQSFSVAPGDDLNSDANCPDGYVTTGGGINYSSTPGVGVQIRALVPFGTSYHCDGHNGSTGSWTGTCQAVCCRTPGR